ncbi:MAG: hypothetical protein C4519_08205 [Desulfobacteraceae bacterium]|nr:MAG: hypothetical protein C4519_08205 [Desulfobacteraceae bacterium]
MALSTLAALGQAAEDPGYPRAGRAAGRVFGLPAGVLGTVVMTYMGTEQEETNVPLWAGAYPYLASFYAATGFANAAAALQLTRRARRRSGRCQARAEPCGPDVGEAANRPGDPGLAPLEFIFIRRLLQTLAVPGPRA